MVLSPSWCLAAGLAMLAADAGVAAQPHSPGHKHYTEPEWRPASPPGPLPPRLQNLGRTRFP